MTSSYTLLDAAMRRSLTLPLYASFVAVLFTSCSAREPPAVRAKNDDERNAFAPNQIGIRGDAVISLQEQLAALASGDPTTRKSAAEKLGSMGVDAQAAVGNLLATLKNDDDHDVRIAAGFAVADIAPTSAEVIRSANDADKTVCMIMGQAIPPEIRAQHVPYLIDLLASEDKGIRGGAVITLGTAVGIQSITLEDVIPALRKGLVANDPNMRRGAAVALGALGAKSRDAIPDLRRLVNDPVVFVADAAREALMYIQPRGAESEE